VKQTEEGFSFKGGGTAGRKSLWKRPNPIRESGRETNLSFGAEKGFQCWQTNYLRSSICTANGHPLGGRVFENMKMGGDLRKEGGKARQKRKNAVRTRKLPFSAVRRV